MATNTTTQKSAKKMVDSWKSKSWYMIVSPKFLGEAQVAEVPATDEEHLLNRIITLPLKEITHDISHMYVNISLRVSEIKGKTAYTKFIGHEVSREYLSTLVRRGRDVLRLVLPVKSKDGVDFVVKTVIVTGVDCSGLKKKAFRHAAESHLIKTINGQEFGQFIQNVISGKANSELYGKLKKIAPIKRTEIYKTQLTEVFDVEEIVQLDYQKTPTEKSATVQAESAETPAAETEEPKIEEQPAEEEQA